MPRYPLGAMVLLLTMIFLLFGMAQGMTGRLKLTSKTVLAATGIWWAASLFEIPVQWGKMILSINPGGTLIPLTFGLLMTMKTSIADRRIWLGAAAFAVSGFLGQQALGLEPDHYLFDGHWLFAFFGTVSAVVLAVESRGALAAVLLGSALVEGLGPVYGNYAGQMVSQLPVSLGTGLAFDRVVVSALLVFPLSFIFEHVTTAKAGTVRWLPGPVTKPITDETDDPDEMATTEEGDS